MRVLVLLRQSTAVVFLATSIFSTILSAQSISTQAAFRFLQQSSWGPNAATVGHVQQLGYSAYLDEQFTLPSSPLPDVTGTSMAPVQQQFYVNAVNGQDQLRQRVAFALSEIWVVSALKITDPNAMNHYLQVLQKDAFANYETLMTDVTLNPAMGHYLDMVNNDKPNIKTGRGANENYARELMQLFTMGLSELNQDGSVKLDQSGNPIVSYTQDQVEGFARSFTGWTYAPMPGATPLSHNPAYFLAPMVAVQANHDTAAKTLLNGVTLPASQTAEKDLADALHNIFMSPNVGPFICRQLIQHLVTSDPSPAYVQRIAAVFADNGSHVRGDLKAVVRAILLDSEARQGDTATPPNGEGHLMEPVLWISNLLRAFGAQVALPNSLPSYTLGQQLYFSPSVFNYFPPDNTIGGTTTVAPEFAILSPSIAMSRADFVNTLVYGAITGVTLDLTPYTQLAANPPQMMAALSSAMPISAQTQQSILKAMQAATTAKAKAQCALYLIGSSQQYQVQR